MKIEGTRFAIEVLGQADRLWTYTGKACAAVNVAAPVFHVDGKTVPAGLKDIRPMRGPQNVGDLCSEHHVLGTFVERPDLSLKMIFRIAPDCPVVRFRYVLKSKTACMLTKAAGRDELVYLGVSVADRPDVKEVQVSTFNEMVHSYCPVENELTDRHFQNGTLVMGPILTAGTPTDGLLVAYEHGSQVPDAFLQYALAPDRRIELRAVKGNYYHGQALDPKSPYETIWLQLAVVAGSEETLAGEYRTFVLKHQSANKGSRRPYIFYNTWAFQERNKWWGKHAYLDSMNQERMLAEIDVAHRMGVDVFVLDTGWYEKTGDWRVNRQRFPDGLKAVREKLTAYGMKLGLWFSPTEAAVSSRILNEHRDCLMSWKGTQSHPHAVWETEESQNICLVSRYADAFADELVRLVKEVGVTYFKWDAIGQYGCDDPRHQHGAETNAGDERAECYAFRQPMAMAHIVDRVCAACPEAIVDFDITEGGRCVGLSFLSAGKYFLINNGPYYPNYDIPYDWATAGTWSNMFVNPGPARGWICRTPLTIDKWIPSVLFLTHYLPDDPADSQLINIASLILGQNGIWGDLLQISDEGVKRFGRLLTLYKHVRYDVTESAAIRTGPVGGNPEIYEKISERSERGVVVAFASAAGRYTYVTHRKAMPKCFSTEGVTLTHDAEGHAVITFEFSRPSARIVFFGVDGCERRM